MADSGLALDARPDADGGAASPEGAAASPALWIDKPLYRFRMDDIRRCEAEGAPSPGAELRVAVAVRLESRGESLAITSGDFTLESGGIITRAELTGGSRGCGPALPRRRLKFGQTVRGFVEFRIPPSQRTTSAALVLAYRPTRWGGADRAEIKLPACFGLLGFCVDGDPPAADLPRPPPARKSGRRSQPPK